MNSPVSLRIEDLADSAAMQSLLAESLATVRHDLPALGDVYEAKIRQAIWKELVGKIDFDLFDWLAEAWATAEHVRSLAREPGPVTQELKSWPITGHLHPLVTVRIGSVTIELPFTIAVTATFGLIELTIGAGYIKAMATGHCAISAQISCRNAPLGPEHALKTFALPFVHTLKSPGLAIVP